MKLLQHLNFIGKITFKYFTSGKEIRKGNNYVPFKIMEDFLWIIVTKLDVLRKMTVITLGNGLKPLVV
jgi:hypothetical protein